MIRKRDMRVAGWNLALLLLGIGSSAAGDDVQLAGGRKHAGESPCLPVCPPEASAAVPPADATAPPATSAFDAALASAGEAGTQPAGSYLPGFFGDLLGGFGTKLIPNSQTTRFVFAPINRHAGAIKITDNESPRPVDRVFYFYNEFSYVNYSSNTALPPINLQRHVLGFEKTFLDGWASFGMRVPFVQTDGVPQVATRQLADMTLIAKLALWDDRRSGNLVSAGLALTVPNGETETFVAAASRNRFVLADVLVQPWAGYIYTMGPRLYAHGFHAIAVPTDSRDVTVLFNDVGLGLWLWRNGDDPFVRGIVPTMELHVNTPLNRRGKQSSTIGFSDLVDLTWGVNVMFPRSTFGGAVGLPLTGPRPYGVEAMARYQLDF